MLVKFSVKGFKNFENELSFDLSQIKNYEFNRNCIKNSIVNSSIIYGPNSSGKSNLGYAIFDIISHMTDNEKNSQLYSNYIYGGMTDYVAKFNYTFNFNGSVVNYQYGKESHDNLIYEKLTIDNHEVVSYDRREKELPVIELEGAENLNRDIGNSKISIIKYIVSNTILKENKQNTSFLEFYSFVNKMLFFRSLDANSYIGYETGAKKIFDDIIEHDNLKDFEKFLNIAGINYTLSSERINGVDEVMICFDEKKLPFWSAASTGTKSLSLFYYWLQRIKYEKDVSFVYIDEFDAFYHHKLARLIVEQLIDTQVQFTLTTHNTSIMSNDLLRPDCYFILNENKIISGANLTNKELRKAHNIEKMYRAGAFNG